MNDPTRSWKLSPMDVESRKHWVEYSKAKDEMFAHTDTKQAPWYVVNADDKKRARLNCIAAMLHLIPYKKMRQPKVELPNRSNKGRYDDRNSLSGRNFVTSRY